MFNHRCQVCAWGVAGDEGLLGGAGAAHAELLLRHEEAVIHHPALLPHHTLLERFLNVYIDTIPIILRETSSLPYLEAVLLLLHGCFQHRHLELRVD